MHKYFDVARYILVGKNIFQQIRVIYFLCQTLTFPELVRFINNLCQKFIVIDDYINILTEKLLNYINGVLLHFEYFKNF